MARYAGSLAALLAEETGASPGDLTPSVVANTLIGIHRAVLDYVRQRITADPADLRRLAQDLQADAEKALGLLAGGLAGYGVSSMWLGACQSLLHIVTIVAWLAFNG
jgi:hypothetical protein